VSPSFLQFRDTEELWRRFPGREGLDEDRAALTFDDGPDPAGTPAVLDALDAVEARATFFMLGEQAVEHRALAREVAERGHEVALHGFTHRPREELGATEARDELARGLRALEAATGRRPRLFRPPYGRFAEDTYSACRELGLEPCYWSAWGMDWEPLPPERIADLVTRDLVPGSILVLHDSARYGSREDVGPTVAALRPIARVAGDLGLELGPIGA
jgi:peptidoglycan/xylan/chitin deacetylase (PgdA/CDA1 family)